MPIHKKYKLLFLYLSVVTLIGTFIFYKVKKNGKSLDKNLEILTVSITDVEIYKGTYFLLYTFDIKNKAYEGQTALNVANANLTYLKSVFTGQRVLLAVDSTNESNNTLLLSRYDYERFQLKPSDSILTVFQKIDSLRITKFH